MEQFLKFITRFFKFSFIVIVLLLIAELLRLSLR